MPSVDDLIEQHGQETIRKAFWLQDTIYREGLEAANFTEAAEESMRQIGPMRVKRRIENNTTRDI